MENPAANGGMLPTNGFDLGALDSVQSHGGFGHSAATLIFQQRLRRLVAVIRFPPTSGITRQP
jgi:hypothetical protein